MTLSSLRIDWGGLDVSSVNKALQILRKLGEPPYEYSLTELSGELGLTRSNLFKILKDLESNFFVIKETSSKKYHLGPINLRLGTVYGKLVGFNEIAKPVLKDLRDKIGETVYTCIWEGDRVVVLDKETCPGSLYDRNDFIGKSLPVNCGSSGKLLFAYRGPEKTRDLLELLPLQKRTPNTIMDKEELLREYSQIREQGYSYEDETFDMGVMGLSVPIFSRTGDVNFCLSMNAEKNEKNPGRLSLWLRNLQTAAESISYHLQFR